jgi:hypothetical protein
VAKFYFTKNYSKELERIEDFILESTENIEQVEKFLDEHDQTLEFISQNPKTPAIHPTTGDDTTQVFLLHIIDNREANLKIYPGNNLPTYYEEE